MVPRSIVFTVACFACPLPAALPTQASPSTPQQTASTAGAEPMRFKVLESFVTSHESARDGWADVGLLVTGHGRGILIPPSGKERLINFSYAGCPGAVVTSKDVFVPVSWKSNEEVVISVFLEGVFPAPVPQHGDCTLHLSKAE